MESAALPVYKPSGKFNLPGMALTLLGGIAAGIIAGGIIYLISQILPLTIPLVFPAILGVVAGYATLQLGSTRGKCRNRILAMSVAIIAAVAAWSTAHVIDYIRFRADAYASITAEVPQATQPAMDRFIDQWLQEQSGQSGFIGFMLLKSKSQTVEITSHQYGIPLAGLKFTGPMLIFYWLIELLLAAGLAAYINRNYAKEPFCEACNTWRKHEVPMLGSVVRVDEAIDAFRRRDIPLAVEALGAYEQGDFVRLELDYCPACFEDTRLKVVTVRDLPQQQGRRRWLERTVWSDQLDANSARNLLQLAH